MIDIVDKGKELSKIKKQINNMIHRLHYYEYSYIKVSDEKYIIENRLNILERKLKNIHSKLADLAENSTMLNMNGSNNIINEIDNLLTALEKSKKNRNEDMDSKQIRELEHRIEEQNNHILGLESKNAETDDLLNKIFSSKAWRLITLYRKIKYDILRFPLPKR